MIFTKYIIIKFGNCNLLVCIASKSELLYLNGLYSQNVALFKLYTASGNVKERIIVVSYLLKRIEENAWAVTYYFRWQKYNVERNSSFVHCKMLCLQVKVNKTIYFLNECNWFYVIQWSKQFEILKKIIYKKFNIK